MKTLAEEAVLSNSAVADVVVGGVLAWAVVDVVCGVEGEDVAY